MVFERVFEKELTEADIKHRFSFPTEHLEKLPFQGKNRDAEFEVGCEDGSVWRFCCIKRQEGKDYPKPTITRGWSRLVRDKDLRVGDNLTFYKDDNKEGRFRIEVQRRPGIWLFGVFHPGPTDKWIRIV